jgi:hypothetical protein
MFKKLIIISLAFISSFNLVCKKDDGELKNGNKLQFQNMQFTKQGEVYFQDKAINLKTKIDVEIAETEETRRLGLMFREKLEEMQGMLFIFQDEEEQGFYMKNTMIPLDIIFVNSKKEIVKIHKNTTPYSEKTLNSVKPVLFVVEVNAGFTDKFGIKEGDYIDWKRF